jgi:hypothetical protein
MSYSMWRQLTDDPDGRLNTLRGYAQEVFHDEGAARRWLGSINLAVGRGDTPATACSTAHGFFEAMAELARLERFRQREASKRARLTTAVA